MFDSALRSYATIFKQVCTSNLINLYSICTAHRTNICGSLGAFQAEHGRRHESVHTSRSGPLVCIIPIIMSSTHIDLTGQLLDPVPHQYCHGKSVVPSVSVALDIAEIGRS